MTDNSLNDRMRENDERIGRLNQEATQLRTRISESDPINSTLPAGQSAATNNFGINRQITDAQTSFGDKLQALEGEKISLMKRLNMVLSELEKATHEKSDIAQKLREKERQAEGLKRKLDEVSSLRNVVNRNLQDDLKYERDLNTKLRDELDRFEREKETLLAKLREEEELGSEIARETQAINSNLLHKTDDLKKLECEHEIASRRLRELNEQLEVLRMQEVKTRQSKILMDEQLHELTNQRNDLIKKINELSDKYENYVNTMNRERVEITKANKRHIRILVAKLLVQIMDENLRKKRKRAFGEIYSTARQMTHLEYKLNRMQRILQQYSEDRSRLFLRRWYRNALDCVHENFKRNQLIDGNVAHKVRTEFFYHWRNVFLNRRRNFGDRMQSMKIIQRLTHSRQELTTRNAMCRWRDFVERRQAQDDFLRSMCARSRQRDLRRAYVTWLSFCKREDLINRYENLSEMVTETWFKQRIFLALKHGVQQSKAETSHFKFTAWKNWCETARKNKYHDKKEALVDKTQALRQERLVKKVFDAIRYGNVQHKFETTRDLLEQKIPEREELEYRRECLIKNAATRAKLNLFRNCYLRHCDVMQRALLIWRNACSHHNHEMQRLKMRLISHHNNRRRDAFMKWKIYSDRQYHLKLLQVTEDCMNQNQNSTNELNRNNEIRKQQIESALRQQMAKLVRVRNLFNRKSLRIFYDKWVGSASHLCDLENAIFKTAKTCHKRRLRMAFNKYRSQVQAAKRKEFIDKKCDWFAATRSRTTAKDVWLSWVQYIKQYKLAKQFLNRANNGIERNAKCDAFQIWKETLARSVHTMYNENIMELKKRQADQKKQIEAVSGALEEDKNQRMHTISKMNSLGHKIMANFITRMTHMQVARGFYSWLDATKNYNKKVRMVRKAVVYWMKIHQQRAFRKWADNAYAIKEEELKNQLEAKQKERRELVRFGNQQAIAAEKEETELQQALGLATKQRESLKQQFKNAFNTHVGRVSGNTYIEKHRNIFMTWRDFVRREKNAVNVIGAIARRTLRTEVFQRIRLVARERHLDKQAAVKCWKLFTSVKEAALRDAFSKWRMNSYKSCVGQLEATELKFEQTVEEQGAEMQQIIKAKHRRAERVLRVVKLRDANLAFKQMTRYLKALRVKQEVLKQNLNYMRAKRATQKWFQRVQMTQYLRRRQEQVIKNYKELKMRNLFLAWKNMNRDEKKYLSVMKTVINRMRYYDVASYFQKWQQTTISAKEREQESQEHGAREMGLILDRLRKRRLALFLHNLKLRGAKKEFKEKYLRRMINHNATYRMRHFFDRWRHVNKLEVIAHTVNTEGDVVMRRNEASRHAKAMKEYLTNSGYSEAQVENYLDQKAADQKQTMTRGIIGFFFQNSEFQIVPKALNQWKEYVAQRKRVKEAARFVLNRMYRPRLTSCFYRWKYDMADNQKKLLDLSKGQLIEKIIADENLIGATKSRLTRLDDAIDHLAIQRENLLGHFIRGQKLAVTLMKNNVKKSLFRGFLKWKRWNQEYENLRLIEQLDRTNHMISDLSHHVTKLEGINRQQLSENEELRQAALDGIEIAKVVQELTKEREALSGDLNDRAGTIKRLIEENNNLSVKLNIAQKEAQQLDALNQQVYQMPTREHVHR